MRRLLWWPLNEIGCALVIPANESPSRLPSDKWRWHVGCWLLGWALWIEEFPNGGRDG